jgi:Fe-S-cluster containining protein
MPHPCPHIHVAPALYDPWADRLTALWADMDAAYKIVAEQYGFQCQGCVDNCCRTRFYHHTVLEYLYIYQGFGKLEAGLQDRFRQQAQKVAAYQARTDRDIQHADHMCPLNVDGRCYLYAHRPMICRLHGLPHELHPGTGRLVRGPGCDAFDQQCREHPYVAFDRTPFYRRMAELERGLRQASGYGFKIKMTLAEMIACF